jgi:tellurite resistance protein TehA-like permease
MNQLVQFKPVFLLSLIVLFAQYLLKYFNLPGRNLVLLFYLLLTLVWIIFALNEIYRSNRISSIEKIMWTISFIGVYWIAGLCYLAFRRPKIFKEYKILYNSTSSPD